MGRAEYWAEAVEISLDENGVAATPEQIAAIAADMESSHDMYAEYSGQLIASTNRNADVRRERTDLEAELAWERDKRKCPVCDGKGELIEPVGTAHRSVSQCWKCGGSGKTNDTPLHEYKRRYRGRAA